MPENTDAASNLDGQDEENLENTENSGDGGEDGDGDDPELKDEGKQALDRMKGKWKSAEQKRRDAEARADAAEAKLADATRTPDEQAVEQARREARAEATSAANKRIVSAEVRAAAAGKLANPSAALKFLDLEQFEVDDDGEVDASAVADAIDKLLIDEPYLAATREGFPKNDTGATRRGREKPAETDPDAWLRDRARRQ